MMMMHGLSFDIEEHFQVAAFDSVARRRHWGNLESRVERNTHLILDLLEARGIHATMFVLGWVAERHKGLIRRIVESGHELASHGYAHELITGQTPPVFREDIRRAKHILEDIGGRPILGYRAPAFSIGWNRMSAIVAYPSRSRKIRKHIEPKFVRLCGRRRLGPSRAGHGAT